MLHLTLEDQLFLGQPKQVGTHSTVHDHLAVMFEDDGETGYFYALDMRQNAQPVVDCAVFDFAHLIGYNTNKNPQPDLMSMWTHEEITNERATAWLGVNTIK